MVAKLTPEAKQTIERAQEAARGFAHDFVGTEHLLLALIRDDSGVASHVLKAFNLSTEQIEHEIEMLVERGKVVPSQEELPLTPRAQQAVSLALEEAENVGQTEVHCEHLLLGLLREPAGVAGKVLTSLGLRLEGVRDEVLKIRLMQMKIVESAVRPVRATVACKRKMRDELFAHLTAIYEEEQSRLHDPLLATKEAARRLGDPKELARELQSSVSLADRYSYRIERLLGQHDGTSQVKTLLRQSVVSLIVLGGLALLTLTSLWAKVGLTQQMLPELRPVFLIALLAPVDQFLIGLSYFKLRDALFGALGARKSNLAVAAYAFCMAAAIMVGGIVFIVLSGPEWALGVSSLVPWSAVAGGVAILMIYQAHRRGAIEIRDTLWASLELEGNGVSQTN